MITKLAVDAVRCIKVDKTNAKQADDIDIKK